MDWQGRVDPWCPVTVEALCAGTVEPLRLPGRVHVWMGLRAVVVGGSTHSELPDCLGWVIVAGSMTALSVSHKNLVGRVGTWQSG